MREQPQQASDYRTIDPQFTDIMNALARGLDGALNGDLKGTDRKVGFALLTFNFDDFAAGRVNYISNANREDMIAAVKSWLARAEGRVAIEPKAVQ